MCYVTHLTIFATSPEGNDRAVSGLQRHPCDCFVGSVTHTLVRVSLTFLNHLPGVDLRVSSECRADKRPRRLLRSTWIYSRWDLYVCKHFLLSHGFLYFSGFCFCRKYSTIAPLVHVSKPGLHVTWNASDTSGSCSVVL